ncbi:D-alanyl-D-alanine carboxypeptidase family protein [Bacillota bacterium Lsc_1132]
MSKIALFLLTMMLVFSSQSTIFAAERNPKLDVKSEAAVLLDSETGAVLFAKNPDEKLYPASLTKIATAIYAIEKGNLNDIVTVSANAVRQEGTRVYLNEGEQVPLKKLIQGMLINSGNDAAVAVAEHLDGNVGQFAKNVNLFLKTKIGVRNTNFTNPNGLFDQDHYTTAMDLALITNYAMKNPVFAEIFGTKELKWNGQSWNTTLFTHHRMLKGEIPYPGITGGKTGYVDESKQTLATTANNGKLKLTVIELRGNNKKEIYNDTIHLLDYGFTGFQHNTLTKSDIFEYGKQEFFPENNALYTEPIQGAKKEVNKKGLLSIKDQQGQTIQTVQLTAKEKKPSLNNKPITGQTYHLNAIYGIAIFALVGLGVGLRRKFTN